MKVSLISVTQPFIPTLRTAEDLIVYTARVSSPQNQKNLDTGAKLLKYCIDNNHVSVFEQADMTVEIITSRAISAQILRHKSFSFQEFSQRYAVVPEMEKCKARRQDNKNRQNSHDDLPFEDIEWFSNLQEKANASAIQLYNQALARGIAKEQARFLLPMSAKTVLYMKGSVRSWMHYLDVRCHESTQKEHRDIADEIKNIFKQQFPVVYESKWKSEGQ